MTSAPLKRIVFLAGPTGSGKTATAVELASRLRLELIGADSVQVYRRFDIGSAKPSVTELRGIPHHLLDVADPDEAFNAGRYVELADRAIREIQERGNNVLVVGGTGLYLRSLWRGLARDVPTDAEVRARLNARAAESPEVLAAMHEEVKRIDPTYAAKIHPTDPIRIVRALEVFELTGEPLSLHHARHAAEPPRYEVLYLALSFDRPVLKTRLEARTRAMLANGWIEETQALLDAYGPDIKPLKSVGYAEIVKQLLEKRPANDEATIERIVYSTLAFAKRQRTWFRSEEGLVWTSPEALLSADEQTRIERFFASGER